MIKVKILLDGNQFGCYETICNETIQQFIEYMNYEVNCIGLTEKDTNRLISIPVSKYVVIVDPIDE